MQNAPVFNGKNMALSGVFHIRFILNKKSIKCMHFFNFTLQYILHILVHILQILILKTNIL